MTTTNNITGDVISSRAFSDQGRVNYDNIFAKKTAQEWIDAVMPGTILLDPDGWRYDDGVTLKTPISRREFNNRIGQSTCMHYTLRS